MNNKKKLDYGENINEYIYDKVPQYAMVLDVGCWRGALGEKLKSKKGCKVVGIDNNFEALNMAKKRLDSTLLLNLENYESPRINNKFDVIIFADVLEHLRDPPKVIDIFSKFLKKDGFMLVSLPNVANIKNRLNLMRGNWNYTNTGVLDKTHLRFYTQKTCLKLFPRSKFDAKIIDSTPGFSFFFFRYFNFLKKIRYILCKIYPRLFSLQFIIKIKKR